jgi:hypothetical protein
MPTENDDNGGTPPPDGRLPYEKPAVAWQEKLEVRPGLLAICQKVAAAGPDCDAANSES